MAGGRNNMPFTNTTPKADWVEHPIVIRSNQDEGSSVIALLWKESGKDEDAVLKKQLPLKTVTGSIPVPSSKQKLIIDISGVICKTPFGLNGDREVEYGLSFLTMMVDVYQTNKQGTYLFLPSGEPFSSVSQPVRDSVGLLQFLNTVELVPEILSAKHLEIQADLEKQGYAIHEAEFKITEHE